MLPESGTAAPEPTVEVPLSTVFCADDADVVIRAGGSLDFRAHKFILSLVSPVFKIMFTVPQPPTDAPGTRSHVDVHDSAETWENILRIIYVMPNPVIDDLDDLESLLLAARKYEMQAIVDIYKKGLENQGFVQKDPWRLYSIACAYGFEDQAKYVARNAELVTVTRGFNADGSRGVTLGSYHNLVSFVVERDKEWYQSLIHGSLWGNRCSCDTAVREELSNKIKEDLKRPFSQMEVYLKALEDRSRSYKPACYPGEKCAIADPQIKEFIERKVKERENLCDKLMRDKQFIGS